MTKDTRKLVDKDQYFTDEPDVKDNGSTPESAPVVGGHGQGGDGHGPSATPTGKTERPGSYGKPQY